MAAKTGKSKFKQLSRGQRKHVRRAKAEARRAGTLYRAPFGTVRPSATLKKEAAPA
jgi:hypothetical protein